MKRIFLEKKPTRLRGFNCLFCIRDNNNEYLPKCLEWHFPIWLIALGFSKAKQGMITYLDA